MTNLSKLDTNRWNKFVEKVMDQEENDNHVDREVREEMVNEFKRRNPNSGVNFTGDVDNDFVECFFS